MSEVKPDETTAVQGCKDCPDTTMTYEEFLRHYQGASLDIFDDSFPGYSLLRMIGYGVAEAAQQAQAAEQTA